jgi:release factor glutamine methyltransferase
MTTSIADSILQGAHTLRLAGVPEARREAGSLLAHILGRDRSFILSHAEDAIKDDHAELFRRYLQRRAEGEPLQYITGQQEFFGLVFEVNRNVLIPRPETELLIETALKLVGTGDAAPSICDVGTGSGCIGITLVHELPQAFAVALDISPEALKVAERNAARHSVADRISFIVSNCFSGLDQTDAQQSCFDLIVSNPPYVESNAMASLQKEVKEFEPHVALVAGEDGLTVIRRLLSEVGSFLRPGGFFVFEIGFNQAAAVEQLIDQETWRLLGIHADLQGIPRTVALQKLS